MLPSFDRSLSVDMRRLRRLYYRSPEWWAEDGGHPTAPGKVFNVIFENKRVKVLFLPCSYAEEWYLPEPEPIFLVPLHPSLESETFCDRRLS